MLVWNLEIQMMLGHIGLATVGIEDEDCLQQLWPSPLVATTRLDLSAMVVDGRQGPRSWKRAKCVVHAGVDVAYAAAERR